MLLLGTGGNSHGSRPDGSGPASLWGRCEGRLLQALGLGWGQARVDFEPEMGWWCCGRGGRAISRSALTAHALSSSEPTRHLLRQLSEKGECEGSTANQVALGQGPEGGVGNHLGGGVEDSLEGTVSLFFPESGPLLAV